MRKLLPPSIINSPSFYHIAVHLFWRFANVFFLLVYLYCQCFFVLSCWCCCWYILSFPVGFYCLYLLRKVPLPHSICLIFWGFVLNYISLAILTSFSQHLLLLLLLLLWQKLKSTKIHTTVPRQQYCVLTGENKNPIQ